MDIIRNGAEQPVFELGDEPAVEEDELPARSGLQLGTLLTPEALAIAGVILAVLAGLGPFTSFLLLNPFFGEGPPKGWTFGPHIAQAATALALGLTSWRIALSTEREIPRLAGVAVVVGMAILALLGVVWSYNPPTIGEG